MFKVQAGQVSTYKKYSAERESFVTFLKSLGIIAFLLAASALEGFIMQGTV